MLARESRIQEDFWRATEVAVMNDSEDLIERKCLIENCKLGFVGRERTRLKRVLYSTIV